MKAFISYSTALDQIIALRLQTMAAVYGVTSYVPPATTRQPDMAQIIPEVRQNLQDSDVVLAVITHNPTLSAIYEMNWAVEQHKLLIPIVSAGVAPEYFARFVPYFIVNPADPSKVETQIVDFLVKQDQQAQSSKTALVALATLTVALLVFGSLAQDS